MSKKYDIGNESKFKLVCHSMTANGDVDGKLWGGGYVGYAAEQVQYESSTDGAKKVLSDLKVLIQDMLDDGILDSGMGYDELLGAIMVIDHQITWYSEELDVSATSVGKYDGKTFKFYKTGTHDKDEIL